MAPLAGAAEWTAEGTQLGGEGAVLLKEDPGKNTAWCRGRRTEGKVGPCVLGTGVGAVSPFPHCSTTVEHRESEELLRDGLHPTSVRRGLMVPVAGFALCWVLSPWVRLQLSGTLVTPAMGPHGALSLAVCCEPFLPLAVWSLQA